MSIRRVVPDINSTRVAESREFYVGVLGFKVVRDLGGVVTFASPTNPTAQITIIRDDGASRMVPQLTVEVEDVDAIHAEAVRRGAEVVYPLPDERWGVRRFFLHDANGVVVHVMRHNAGTAPSGS